MTPLLLLAGAVSLAWAVVLLAFRTVYVGTVAVLPVTESLARNLAIGQLVLGALFLFAARDPARNRGAIYAAILLSALKTINDGYDVVVLLPPDQALFSLADLVLSVGLAVGLLEALPRTIGTPPREP
ncbi:hypothetical protein L6Q96_13105 [Candidatus Binatia bacterium]|nr:hypothetical protein [Candidatus Binatia bacterium]